VGDREAGSPKIPQGSEKKKWRQERRKECGGRKVVIKALAREKANRKGPGKKKGKRLKGVGIHVL